MKIGIGVEAEKLDDYHACRFRWAKYESVTFHSFDFRRPINETLFETVQRQTIFIQPHNLNHQTIFKRYSPDPSALFDESSNYIYANHQRSRVLYFDIVYSANIVSIDFAIVLGMLDKVKLWQVKTL